MKLSVGPWNMKRTMSESESDELFDETMKGSPSQSCPVSARKKRRGIIEKRRRDRINNSLTELRRLVPAAFEKQGSAKLEKAEILQMTVDHLKYLHAKGIDGSFHPYGEAHAYAMDYRVLGFRECASEVARYLVTVEGMDIQDPLRLRLMSHLQCYVAQREFQTRQHYTVSGHSQFPAHTHSQTPALPPPPHSGPQHNAGGGGGATSEHHPASLPPAVTSVSENSRQMLPMITSTSHAESQLQTSCHGRLPMPAPPTGVVSSAPIGNSQSSQLSTQIAPSLPIHSQYSVPYNSLPVLSPNGYTGSPTSTSLNSHTALVSKPYRPWGTEMAY
ncbi:hairy/enhancer-of-split related with YRPW motif protein 1-like isoform X1 [Lytechinus pictus]|uniref:hairy/enhancer-of-split related with YRPW motif protein 1-like isoform X1 n=1 Tax=Lytechinus pictus TaxID=7653 RepID=UPI00240DC8E3|nr:hairy/enhancer-of-split related with YRPW motif protein 1-like [Lytechinus pictus]